MSAQPIAAIDRDDPLTPQHPYRRLLRGWTKAQVGLERALNEVVSYEQNPFYFHGAIPTFVFWMLILSGLGLLFYFKPTITEAYNSLRYMQTVPFGNAIRSSHRYSADAMMIALWLHMYRVYVTDRHREYRWQPWVTGVLLLLITYGVGITGYWLCGDQRAWGLVYQTRQVLATIPLAGPYLEYFLLGGREVSDFSLVRFIFLHIGGAMLIFWLLWMHLLRIRRPIMIVTFGIGAVVVGLILMVSGLVPASSQAAVLDPSIPPEAYHVGDWVYLPIYALASFGGPGLFLGLSGLFFVGLSVVPWLLHDSRRNIAHVVRDKCVGCQLCAIDCPYNAIKMVPVFNERKQKPDLLAVVYPPRCSECGVCVGSCDFDAIELGSMPYRALEELVKQAAPQRTPAPAAAPAVPAAGE